MISFAELSLPLAWIGHEIQYAYMADSVFLFVFVAFAICILCYLTIIMLVCANEKYHKYNQYWHNNIN